MSKWVCAVAGLALVGAGSAAGAKDKLEPRTQAMLACRPVADAAARLQCYDQAMAALSEAIDQGKVVVAVPKGPIAREGVIKSSREIGDNIFLIELENGDRWKLLPSTWRSRPPAVGSTVRIHRPLAGSGFWVEGPEWDDSRADFVGRGS